VTLAPQIRRQAAFYYGRARHLLIATTALVATAGVAVADVKVSGYGRFGAMYDDATKDTTTRSRLRLQFDASTETDGGLTLAVRQRFQAEENAVNAGGNGARFSASAGGLTVAMGNITGAIEAAPNLYLPTKSAGVGLEGNFFAHLAPSTVSNGIGGWTAYSSAGAGATDGVEVIYSMNGIGVHAHSTAVSYGVGANYKISDYTVALAYEEWNSGARDGDNILFASVGGKIGALNAALSMAQTETAAGADAQKFTLQGAYSVNDALSVYGYVSTEDNSAGEAYGLGASYALGGGASVEAGWEQNTAEVNRVSAGIYFSF
jgi:outer membrane protein OmpU